MEGGLLCWTWAIPFVGSTHQLNPDPYTTPETTNTLHDEGKDMDGWFGDVCDLCVCMLQARGGVTVSLYLFALV